MTLGEPEHASRPAPASVTKKGASAGKGGQRIQTVVLAVATVLVLGAVGWSLYPTSGSGRTSAGAQATTPGAAAHPAVAAGAAQVREDPAVGCLQETTAYRSSAERDQLLRDAIGEFDNGRLERAHARLKEYSEMSCDRATVEAIGMMEHQLEQKSREH